MIVKTVLALLALWAMAAPIAQAQESSAQAGVTRLVAPRAAETEPQPAAPGHEASVTPVAAAPSLETPIAATIIPRAPATPPAALAEPPVAATGWTGPVNFSPIAIADLIGRVCRPALSGDGGDLQAHAAALGLGDPAPAPDGLARALPPGAVTWRAPSVDGVLYLFGYGETPLNCGAAVVRPLAEDGFNKVFDLLQAPDMGFAPESTQILQGDIRWARMKSAAGAYVDLMEYPMQGDAPGVLRAEFLPG